MNKYGVIYCDPPWTFKTYSDAGKGRSAEAHYECMSLDDIKALPIGNLAADDCVLLMWVTDPMLDKGFEVIQSWGFKYKTVGFYWVKHSVELESKERHYPIGTGYWTRCLDKDTKIILFDRRTRKVQFESISFLEGKELNDYRIWSHTGWKHIYGLTKNENTQLYNTETRIGNTKSSMNHRWACKKVKNLRNGEKRKRIHVVEYETLQEINRMKNCGTYQHTASVNLVFSKKSVESPIPIESINDLELTDDLGWLIGLFCAEGNFAKQAQIRFSLNINETWIAEKIKSIVSRLDLDQDTGPLVDQQHRYFNYKVEAHTYEMPEKNGVAAHFSSKLIKSLIENFVQNGDQHNRRLNLNLLLQTKSSFRKSLLKGMLDGDGSKRDDYETYEGFDKLVLCNEELIEDFRFLSHTIGVMTSRVYFAPQKASNGTICSRFAMRFAAPRNKYLELNNVSVTPIEIKGISISNEDVSYDLWVEDNAFIADWMVSHNSNPEQCLLATRGKPSAKAHDVRRLLMAPRREHSRKPDEMYDNIERLCEGPYVELFARYERKGWDTAFSTLEGTVDRKWKSNEGKPSGMHYAVEEEQTDILSQLGSL